MRKRCRRIITRGRRQAKSPCTPGDFAALERLFESKPDAVLSWFQTLGIGCLMELEMFARLRTEQPQTAARIAFIAATMGIPVETP